MKEPIILKSIADGKNITINGLSDFIKKAWLPENAAISRNEKVFRDNIDNLYKATRVLSKVSLNLRSRSSFVTLMVLGVGFLAKRRFVSHTNQIAELKEQYENLKDDYDEICDLRDDIDELKADIFEMEARLHAIAAEKEDQKEE